MDESAQAYLEVGERLQRTEELLLPEMAVRLASGIEWGLVIVRADEGPASGEPGTELREVQVGSPEVALQLVVQVLPSMKIITRSSDIRVPSWASDGRRLPSRTPFGSVRPIRRPVWLRPFGHLLFGLHLPANAQLLGSGPFHVYLLAVDDKAVKALHDPASFFVARDFNGGLAGHALAFGPREYRCLADGRKERQQSPIVGVRRKVLNLKRLCHSTSSLPTDRRLRGVSPIGRGCGRRVCGVFGGLPLCIVLQDEKHGDKHSSPFLRSEWPGCVAATRTTLRSDPRGADRTWLPEGRKDSAIGPFGTCNSCAGWSIILPETFKEAPCWKIASERSPNQRVTTAL